jgi:hypothetical protein
MPKKKHKTLTKTLYCYTRPVNNQWVRSRYKKAGFASYSEYMDALITVVRVGRVRQLRRLRGTKTPAPTRKAA